MSSSTFYTKRRRTTVTLNVYALDVSSKDIGRDLKQHRERPPRISLARLATETKVLTASGISNYEQGIRTLKTREAKILAEAFERLGKPISAATILGLEKGKPVQEPNKDVLYKQAESYRRLAKLVENWPYLTDDTQDHILERAEEIIRAMNHGSSPPVKIKSSRKSKVAS